MYAIGLKSLFAPWLGKTEYALTTLSLISVWQFIGIPMMLAGSAGGRVRTGIHVPGAAAVTSRVGLTIQQVMGLNVERWGFESMEATLPVSEFVV